MMDEAAQSLENALRLDPRLSKEVTSTLQLPPEAEVAFAGAFLDRGREFARQGSIKEATDDFRWAVEFDPISRAEIVQLLQDYGRQHAEQCQTDAALAAFRQAAELDSSLKLPPEREVTDVLVRRSQQIGCQRQTPVPQVKEQLALGCVCAFQGMVQPALDAFRRAADLDPKLRLVPEDEVVKGLVGGGLEHARAGRSNEAMAAIQRAKEISPTLQLVQPELAKVFKVRAYEAFSKPEGYAAVLDFLRQAAEFDPASQAEIAQLCVDFGRQYAQQSQIDAALAAFRLANELDPNLKLVPEDEVARIQREQK